ncbi:MAG: sodium:proton antiporter [Firmicutes bacterium]|nr:sodium:proton antiporter [Bacillota bacterium]
MEYGVLSLIPPLVAIIMALKTKQTILSLFMGVWVGATIINHWNPMVGFVKVISDFMVPSIADSWNAGLIILVALAGGFVFMLRACGGAQAFAQFVTKQINSRKKAQILTCISAFAFSYTEPCLILGTIMRPITDKVRVSRAKLAYILDSMGCNLACFSPISSYGPFITGLIATQIAGIGLSDNPWSIYIKMFPYNLYGIFAMLTVLYVALTGFDIGPMFEVEKKAATTGEVYSKDDKLLMPEQQEEIPTDYNLAIKNFLIPMLSLFITIFAVIFWSGNIIENGFAGSFLNANIVVAISSGFLVGSIAAGFVAISTGLMDFKTSYDKWFTGVIQLMAVPMILIMAWSIGKVAGTMKVGAFLTQIVSSYLPTFLVPALVFLAGALISFSTGSSWGVWSIMMPIAVPMAHGLGISIPLIVGAVISGGLFGDHCSPISDTTILSSTGASCDHIVHVTTQIPYAVLVASGAFIGFLVGGATNNPLLSILTALVIITGLIAYISRKNILTKEHKLSNKA